MGAKVRLPDISVRNPLADATNIPSQSGGCHISSVFDKDVIVIDKENIVIPDSVSPSSNHHRTRLYPSKVYYAKFSLFICIFSGNLIFLFIFFRYVKVLKMALLQVKMRLNVIFLWFGLFVFNALYSIFLVELLIFVFCSVGYIIHADPFIF
jgi:hypothetical protein